MHELRAQILSELVVFRAITVNTVMPRALSSPLSPHALLLPKSS